ncbi:general secretion pathway protein D [Xylophilus ampelinus]|uniref:General secretion pathway protein D n=2 Tax=Xylophilus ampelinus TaxID=54067 RepID=A0A318SRS1_9BURK|nr:general secretion pathway protein D [Xylophilus ampelinus]
MNHLRIATLSVLIAAVSQNALAQSADTTPQTFPGTSDSTSAALGTLGAIPGRAQPPAPPPPDDPAADREPHILRGTDQVIAPPRVAARLPTGARSAFKFEDAPIGEVAGVILGEIAKAEVVFHGQINGAITLVTREPVTPDQAVFLLETALQANGLIMARDARGTYHVGRAEALRGIVAAPRQATGGVLPPGFGAIVVPLRYIGAAEMASILRPIAGGDALVRVDTVRNLLVMTGTRTQAEGWLDIVNTFDVDLLKGMSVGVFPLKYASVSEVEAALQIMSGGRLAAATAAVPGRPGASASTAPGQGAAASAAASAEANPLFGGVRVMPIERINSILVVSPRASALDEARRWIERLDKPNNNTTEPQLHVYGVQNGNAKHLATVLAGIYGGTTSSGGGGTGIAPGLGSSYGNSGGFGGGSMGGSGFGSSSGFSGSTGSFGGSGATMGSSGGMFGSSGSFGNSGFGNAGSSSLNRGTGTSQSGVTASEFGNGIRVIADEVNNAILIYAPNAEFAKIEATLKRLDVRSAQVLIEASIIEVTLRDQLSYGLEWFFKNGGKYEGGGTLGALPATTAAAAATASSGGFAYSLSRSASDVRVVLNALASMSLVKVISSPSLMVLDNQTASIMVGDQVPVQTGTTVSTGGFASTSIQYKDTGVQLQVMPSVNAGNIVTMLLTQAVTDVSSVQDTATQQFPFRQRQITSKVAVRSGEALVLGGLIRDNTSNGRSGIPFLKDLPVIGAAFGATTVAKERTELVVILTPRVVRSDEDIRDVGSEMRDRMKGIFSDTRLSSGGPGRSGAPDPQVELAPGVSGLPRSTPSGNPSN